MAQNEVTAIGRINYSAAKMSSHSSQSGRALDWQPLRGPFSRWPRTADTALALVSLLLTLSMWDSDSVLAEVSPAAGFAAIVIFLIGNLALIWRRSAPFVVHGIAVLISVIAITANLTGGPIFALSISLYSLGRYESTDKRSFLGAGAAVVLLAVEGLLLSAPGSRDLTSLLLALLIWYVGRRIRFRGDYLRLLEERAQQLEHQQSVEAERAVAEERTRIARELHDIVAHQVSLMTVQAGAAKVVADKDPVAAREAIASVESAGRQALNELRHLLGVLRPDGISDARIPQPGVKDLPHLVKELSNAGLTVSLDVESDLPLLPARVDLSVYRIVQEALTNVMKHAGADATARVSVSFDGQRILIEVENNRVAAVTLPGSGHGIAGMRERAQILGGSLQAGTTASGEFRVRATLPIGEVES